MTKTKRFSRIITFALAMLMVSALAVPAFAANITPRYVLGQFDGWNEMNSVHDPLLMNIRRTSSSSANNQAVTLYSAGTYADQMFAIQFSGRDSRPRMYNLAGYDTRTKTGYALNMNSSTYGCILWQDLQDDYRDAEIDALTRTYNGVICSVITLPNRGSRSLTVRNYGVNQQLYWDAKTEAVTQMWHCASGISIR